jgi:hypothetical protein
MDQPLRTWLIILLAVVVVAGVVAWLIAGT